MLLPDKLTLLKLIFLYKETATTIIKSGEKRVPNKSNYRYNNENISFGSSKKKLVLGKRT